MRALAAMVGVVISTWGCKFPDLPEIADDATSDDAAMDGSVIDATVVDATPDASPPCEAGAIECNDDTDVYTQCSAEGTVELQFPCSLGCADDREQCVDFVPSNNVTAFLDQARDLPSSLDVVFTGASVINAATGTVFNAGVSIEVPFATGSNGEGVFMFRSVVVEAGASLQIASGTAILLAGRDVELRGLVDVSANGDFPGPGALSCSFGDGALGFAGTPATAGPGAGGAGGADSGGRGGQGGNGSPGAAGGAASGVSTVPLRGGCYGGASFNGVTQTSGGAGGGALQITSRTAIRIVGQGAIDASGGGGRGAPTDSQHPGSGGGSGGAILLEAPQIVLDGPGVAVSTKGGSGSASGTNSSTTRHGSDGGIGPDPAPGGTSAGMPSGGAGGISGSGQPGESAPAGALAGGGGGGASGRTLFATRTGVVNPQNGAAIRSQWTAVALMPRFAP